MPTDTYSVSANLTTATQVVFGSDPPIPTLITNTSLTAIVYISEDNTARVSDGNGLFPIQPNGSLVVDGTRDFFAVTSSNTPVIIATVAGGLATFLGITQGLGSLAIPSIFSPNFISGVSGWSINKNGSAEFNNVIARGNIVYSNGYLSNGDGTLSTTPGFFLYSGAPAVGNLVYSAASIAGKDQFNNSYLGGGPTTYDNVNFLAINTTGFTQTWYAFTAQPNAVFTANAAFFSGSPGNLQAQINSSAPRTGFEIFDQNTTGVGILAANANGLPVNVGMSDSNRYGLGELLSSANGVAVGGTGTTAISNPIPIGGTVAQPITYDYYARVAYKGNQAAGQPTIGFHPNAMPPGYGYNHFNFALDATWDNVSPTDRSGPVLSATALHIYEMRMRFTSTAISTLTLAGACSIATDTWNSLFCDIRLRPVG